MVSFSSLSSVDPLPSSDLVSAVGVVSLGLASLSGKASGLMLLSVLSYRVSSIPGFSASSLSDGFLARSISSKTLLKVSLSSALSCSSL